MLLLKLHLTRFNATRYPSTYAKHDNQLVCQGNSKSNCIGCGKRKILLWVSGRDI